MFFEGRYLIEKAAMAWRRVFLKTIMFLNVCANSRIMAALSPVVGLNQFEDEGPNVTPDTCEHPVRRRRTGQNG
eukprot:9483462-Pyramimonas_sp.AAC.1